MMNDFAKLLMIIGGLILLTGAVLYFYGRIPWLFNLPGDIVIKRKNFTFYFPLMTSILLSLLLTLIFYMINKFK